MPNFIIKRDAIKRSRAVHVCTACGRTIQTGNRYSFLYRFDQEKLTYVRRAEILCTSCVDEMDSLVREQERVDRDIEAFLIHKRSNRGCSSVG